MVYLIIYLFGLELPEDAVPLVEVSFNFGIISIVVLFCFVNGFGYLLANFLLDHYNIDDKYPKLKGLIFYFKKSSLIFLLIELFFGFVGLFVMIYLGFSSIFIL